MARLKDVPHVVRSVGWFTFIRRVWQQVGEDSVFTWGSALAYSWIFAVFPFLIFLLSLVPLIPAQYREHAKPQIEEWIDKTIPSQAAAKIIKDQALPILDKQSAGGFLSFGLILTLWAASGGMAMTMTALDRAYDIEKGRSWIRQRLVAIGLTIAVTTLVIVVMVLLPVSSAALTWLTKHGSALLHIELSGWIVFLINMARYALALLLLILITSLIYHFGPNLKQKYRAVSPGAVFCITVWLGLGFLFRMYLSRFGGAESYNKTYGAVAGLVILLLFFYVDALVLLMGAEINSEIDFAIAGVPSGDSPQERAVAPIPTEENKELAQELLDKGGETSRTEPPATH